MKHNIFQKILIDFLFGAAFFIISFSAGWGFHILTIKSVCN